MVKKVDATALKFNQASLIALTLLGFLLDQPYLALFVGLVLALGTVWPQAALFKLVYLKLLKPYNILQPNFVEEDPVPHQFAQGVGALVLLASSALLAFDRVFLGWSLVWLVIILAAFNLFFNFCAGCFIFYHLDRVGLIPHSERG